jgi:hypothetical protein
MSQGFIALLLESIDIALISPTSDAIERIKQEATDNLREVFDSAALFTNAVLVADCREGLLELYRTRIPPTLVYLLELEHQHRA